MNFGARERINKPFKRSPRRLAQEGDLIILSAAKGNYEVLRLEKDCIFNNKYGHFHHNDIIGSKFGEWVRSRAINPTSHKQSESCKSKKNSGGKKMGFGELCVLQATCEIWANALLHRTQITYHADCSLILLGLNVRPGNKIYESGTGSGCLSVNFGRGIANRHYKSIKGQLFTFEFNQHRAIEARKDFNMLKISNLISVFHRNVVKNGFPTKKELIEMIENMINSYNNNNIKEKNEGNENTNSNENKNENEKPNVNIEIEADDDANDNDNDDDNEKENSMNRIDKLGFSKTKIDDLKQGLIELKNIEDECFIDAIFLDLPQPEKAIESAYNVLGPNRNICSFSPCIEQVQQTCNKLRQCGFIDIKMFEVLSRDYCVRQETYGIINSQQTFKNILKTKLNKRSLNDNRNSNNSTNANGGGKSSLSYQYLKYDRQKNLLLKEGLTMDKIKNILGKEPEKYDEYVMANEDQFSKCLNYTSGKIVPFASDENNKGLSGCTKMYQTMIARPFQSSFGHTGYLTFAKKAGGQRLSILSN